MINQRLNLLLTEASQTRDGKHARLSRCQSEIITATHLQPKKVSLTYCNVL